MSLVSPLWMKQYDGIEQTIETWWYYLRQDCTMNCYQTVDDIRNVPLEIVFKIALKRLKKIRSTYDCFYVLIVLGYVAACGYKPAKRIAKGVEKYSKLLPIERIRQFLLDDAIGQLMMIQ